MPDEPTRPAAAAPGAPAVPPASSPPDINPDAQRVIRRLSAQLGQALAENAMLEDVVQQLQAERLTAGNAPAHNPETAGR